MSWILGYYGQPSDGTKQEIGKITKEAFYRIEQRAFSVYAGGLQTTCHHLPPEPGNPDQEKGFVITGIGLRSLDNIVDVLNRNGWSERLKSVESQNMERNGHYIIVSYDDNQLEIMSDSLGLRTLYVITKDHVTYFSTRSDWLANLTGCRNVDFAGMGSAWFFMNSFACSSHIENITRISPYGKLIINHEGYRCRDFDWKPDRTSRTKDDYSRHVGSFLRPNSDLFDNLYFGLSGGVDSRTLLSQLNTEELKRLRIFVLGESQDPDVLVAKEITRFLNLPLIHYEATFDSADIWIGRVKEYCAFTQAVSPASAIVNLSFHEQLRGEKNLLIDGGFGEIARRIFFNRLLYFGKKHILSKDWPSLYPFVSLHRADIFNTETAALMRKAALQHIGEYFTKHPVNEKDDMENKLDELAVRIYFPTFNAPQQARLDSYTLNYMPFAQPSVLDIMFGIPARERRHGRLFRKIIKTGNKSLMRFPLVKRNTTYPFRFSSLQAYVWVRMKQKMGMCSKPSQVHKFYFLLSDWIHDITGSQSFKNYPYYDHEKIRNIVNGYYSGRHELVDELDWWLAFECWRQSLGS